jgi:hypothetical protein
VITGSTDAPVNFAMRGSAVMVAVGTPKKGEKIASRMPKSMSGRK